MEDDRQMPGLPAARPEFTALSEAEVWKAVDDDSGNNRIAAEVTRLVAGYAIALKARVDRHGNVPPQILHVRVQSPIERVAVLMMMGFVDALGGTAYPVTVH